MKSVSNMSVMSHDARKRGFGIFNQVKHKPDCAARSLKFWTKEEELLHYLCSENKGADQLCSYCTADLRLCFRMGKNHDTALIIKCIMTEIICFGLKKHKSADTTAPIRVYSEYLFENTAIQV